MKKVIFSILVAFMGIMSVTAQEQKSDSIQSNSIYAYVDSLSVKLEKLQHDYDFLYCNYKLEDIQNDLTDLANNINIKSNAVLIDCYHGRFNVDLYIAYRDNYDSSVDLFESLKETVASIKALVALKMLSSNFSEDEIKLLGHCFDVLDKGLVSSESALNYYKTVLGMYKDMR